MFDTSHLHPMLVHFPIALVMAGFLADVIFLFIKKEICLSKAGFYLLLTGTLGAIVTMLSGLLFTSEMDGKAGAMRETHELFAIITVCLLIAASVLRIFLVVRKKEAPALQWIAFTFYGLAAICVSVTGFYGGTLVYNYLM